MGFFGHTASRTERRSAGGADIVVYVCDPRSVNSLRPWRSATTGYRRTGCLIRGWPRLGRIICEFPESHIEEAFGNLTQRCRSPRLIRLIANPSSFDGRRLGVVGYLANNGVDRALGLYVSEVDARNFIVPNSVDLRIEESSIESLIGKYVTLAGTYHAPPEAVSTYNGYLDHISNLKAWGLGDSR